MFAQKFTSVEEFGFISIQCPSWSSAAEGFSLKIYKWVNDYATTISGAAVASKTFENYADNSWLSIYRSYKEDYTETFPAGTYLWVMSSGTEKSGIWKCTDNGSTGSTDAVSYVDGKPVDGQFRCRITSNGSGNYFWDKITWRHSVDGGKTWTDEVDALLPSDGKRDAFSVCDPGVAKWGGWYYIAYTSTEEPNGFDNDLYIARSKTPSGPWEKWSGNGWGQDPQPVIDYEPVAGHAGVVFGAGEPCIVVKMMWFTCIILTMTTLWIPTRTVRLRASQWLQPRMKTGPDILNIKALRSKRVTYTLQIIRMSSTSAGVRNLWQSMQKGEIPTAAAFVSGSPRTV